VEEHLAEPVPAAFAGEVDVGDPFLQTFRRQRLEIGVALVLDGGPAGPDRLEAREVLLLRQRARRTPAQPFEPDPVGPVGVGERAAEPKLPPIGRRNSSPVTGATQSSIFSVAQRW
jgi:hypothetical protein